MTRVHVLAGGFGGERQVSLDGARAVATALAEHERFDATLHEIGRLESADIAAIDPGIFFPVLHGPWGEGGELQALLEQHDRTFVGSRSGPARDAMDKGRTLDRARRLGIPICGHEIVTSIPNESPLVLPVVLKPVADGSSVGVRICRSPAEWSAARELAESTSQGAGPWIIERFVAGRELTVSMLDGDPLPIIEIVPREGFYDYQAKYNRDDTTYVTSPDLPDEVASQLTAHTKVIYRDLALRHLARADFILGAGGVPRFLEINTMPGFTSHSLLPMAAQAVGLAFPDLCARLVDLALRDAKTPMVSR